LRGPGILAPPRWREYPRNHARRRLVKLAHNGRTDLVLGCAYRRFRPLGADG